MIASKELATADDELIVFHVQDPVSPQIQKKLGSAEVESLSTWPGRKGAEADQAVPGKTGGELSLCVGSGRCCQRIIRVSKKERVQMIVMGAHGHGILVRALMGSVAQRVMADCDIPVLMVK